LPKLEPGGGKLSSAYLTSLCTIGGRSLKAIFNFRNLQPPINVPLFVSGALELADSISQRRAIKVRTPSAPFAF
jgi:hypothetical protein